jgi:hypothetical protein
MKQTRLAQMTKGDEMTDKTAHTRTNKTESTTEKNKFDLLSVREMYELSLRKMEMNRIQADQRWNEIYEEVLTDIHHAKTMSRGWLSRNKPLISQGNPRTIANERAKTDGTFKSRVADYNFFKGRVDTYSAILQLAQNEKIISRLDAIVNRL